MGGWYRHRGGCYRHRGGRYRHQPTWFCVVFAVVRGEGAVYGVYGLGIGVDVTGTCMDGTGIGVDVIGIKVD
eukprot:806702-Prorocentrum_minimum.AAC.1